MNFDLENAAPHFTKLNRSTTSHHWMAA